MPGSDGDRYWQERWRSEGLATARRDPGRAKFFAVVAYPGPSGFLHLGHLRGLTLADQLHRYHRMRGRAVFFPTGTHASGLPAVAFAQRVRDNDPSIRAQLLENGVPEAEWAALADPEGAARFLGEQYLGVFRRLGFLIDETAYLTTIDEDYRRFIGWQFRTLHRLGALRQGPYFASVCPVCGPVSVDPSETDLSRGGGAELVKYTTVPFPMEDGRVLLAATLRPETVYGVTNLWISPTEPLVVWHHGTDLYLVGRAGAERLVEQHGGRIGHSVGSDDLVGRTVGVPFASHRVPILASPLVAPDRGSGVVMSVPGHAPADFLALAALRPEDRSRVPAIPEIIFIPPDAVLTDSEQALRAGGGPPAERAARATGARSLADREALDEATERLYRLELLRGRMLVPALGPLTVAEARLRMTESFEAAGTGFSLQEFSEPVVCRNGHAVIVRRVPDQWFLRYSDPEWKAATHELVDHLSVQPTEYARELPGVIDWFEDRPCTRKGRWLGTPFPLDPSWTIEPIADSTFYPAYYILRRFVREGRIAGAALSDALFDFVIRGEGPGEPGLPRELQEEMRAEFAYWYPLDLNIGGKEHKRVHFPVFLFTHARLLPPELRPRGLFVHWWLVAPSGEKISKKHIGTKGGAVPAVRDALERWGADALRLFYVTAASPGQDIEWDPELIDRASERLHDIERMAREALADGPGGSPELDGWLSDAFHDLLERLAQCLEAAELREAAEITYATLPARIRRYLARGGAPGPALQRAAAAWIRALSPLTPHLAEALGRGRFSTLVACQPFPEAAAFEPNPVARAREEYLERVEEDLQGVLRPARARGEAAGSVTFYVASAWKRTAEEWIRGSPRRGSELLRELMERAGAHPELSRVRGELAAYVAKVGPRILSEPAPSGPLLEEEAVLRAAAGYLARRFGFEEVRVHSEDSAEAADPMDRRHRARPGRPAFYLVAPLGAAHRGDPRPGTSPHAP